MATPRQPAPKSSTRPTTFAGVQINSATSNELITSNSTNSVNSANSSGSRSRGADARTPLLASHPSTSNAFQSATGRTLLSASSSHRKSASTFINQPVTTSSEADYFDDDPDPTSQHYIATVESPPSSETKEKKPPENATESSALISSPFITVDINTVQTNHQLLALIMQIGQYCAKNKKAAGEFEEIRVAGQPFNKAELWFILPFIITLAPTPPLTAPEFFNKGFLKNIFGISNPTPLATFAGSIPLAFLPHLSITLNSCIKRFSSIFRGQGLRGRLLSESLWLSFLVVVSGNGTARLALDSGDSGYFKDWFGEASTMVTVIAIMRYLVAECINFPAVEDSLAGEKETKATQDSKDYLELLNKLSKKEDLKETEIVEILEILKLIKSNNIKKEALLQNPAFLKLLQFINTLPLKERQKFFDLSNHTEQFAILQMLQNAKKIITEEKSLVELLEEAVNKKLELDEKTIPSLQQVSESKEDKQTTTPALTLAYLEAVKQKRTTIPPDLQEALVQAGNKNHIKRLTPLIKTLQPYLTKDNESHCGTQLVHLLKSLLKSSGIPSLLQLLLKAVGISADLDMDLLPRHETALIQRHNLNQALMDLSASYPSPTVEVATPITSHPGQLTSCCRAVCSFLAPKIIPGIALILAGMAATTNASPGMKIGQVIGRAVGDKSGWTLSSYDFLTKAMWLNAISPTTLAFAAFAIGLISAYACFKVNTDLNRVSNLKVFNKIYNAFSKWQFNFEFRDLPILLMSFGFGMASYGQATQYTLTENPIVNMLFAPTIGTVAAVVVFDTLHAVWKMWDAWKQREAYHNVMTAEKPEETFASLPIDKQKSVLPVIKSKLSDAVSALINSNLAKAPQAAGELYTESQNKQIVTQYSLLRQDKIGVTGQPESLAHSESMSMSRSISLP